LFILCLVITPSKDGRVIETHKNVEICILNGKITGFNKSKNGVETIIDAQGSLVTPGFVDAHTHLFPPVDRADEFAVRSVKSYKEIAAAGGGILSTVRSFRNASQQDIFEANKPLMQQFFANGTTTVEVKSGYGLTTSDEVKSLRAIRSLQFEFADRMTIVPTFMGAHAVPPEYKGRTNEYVDYICNDMIPEVELTSYFNLHLTFFRCPVKG
jgi:imidazolonepropionase